MTALHNGRVVLIDQSATTRAWTKLGPWRVQPATPVTITTHRYVEHQATVLAWRLVYLANKEEVHGNA